MFMFELRLIRPNLPCQGCLAYFDLVPYTRNSDKLAWRCTKKLGLGLGLGFRVRVRIRVKIRVRVSAIINLLKC